MSSKSPRCETRFYFAPKAKGSDYYFTYYKIWMSVQLAVISVMIKLRVKTPSSPTSVSVFLDMSVTEGVAKVASLIC